MYNVYRQRTIFSYLEEKNSDNFFFKQLLNNVLYKDRSSTKAQAEINKILAVFLPRNILSVLLKQEWRRRLIYSMKFIHQRLYSWSAKWKLTLWIYVTPTIMYWKFNIDYLLIFDFCRVFVISSSKLISNQSIFGYTDGFQMGGKLSMHMIGLIDSLTIEENILFFIFSLQGNRTNFKYKKEKKKKPVQSPVL